MKTITKENNIMMEEIRRLISEGKTVSLTVKGHSMNPFIVHMRDQITLGPVRQEDIRPGTVALVKDSRGSYLIHRITEVKDDTVTLIGDGNVGITETATHDNIIGVMYSLNRNGRIYSEKSRIWRIYSRIWMMLTPIRRYPLALWRKLNRKSVPPLR